MAAAALRSMHVGMAPPAARARASPAGFCHYADIRTTHQHSTHAAPLPLPDYNTACSSLTPPSGWRTCRNARLQTAAIGTAAADSPAPVRGPPGDEASKAFAVAMAKVTDEVKAQDIVVLDVAPVVSWTSFLVICTVSSKPQLMATLARVEKAATEQFGRSRSNLPGSSPWETLDFGDVVVHVFNGEQREYYDIESFYAAADEVELSFLEQGQGQAAAPGSGRPAAGGAPAWTKRV